MVQYIWQTKDWPGLRWKSDVILRPLGISRQLQGRLLGEADYIGLEMKAEVLTEEAFTTAAIEGERLDRNSVRSSVARRLGLPTAGLPPAERQVDGLVEMLIDATTRHDERLTPKRLKGWHAALFPTGYSGMNKIPVADWRKGSEPMRVVSGPVGKERVHYEAPPAARLKGEIDRFLRWWHSSSELDGLVRAAMAHIWFVSIHPFEDGNGRIARAITDMALAQDERKDFRMYSMSAQINADRDEYYDMLEKTQKGDGEITGWLLWFLQCFNRAIQRSEGEVRGALQKVRFWQQWAAVVFNERQKKVVNRLLDSGPEGFEGGLTNRKYKGMTRVSRETAKRDISDLVEKGVLIKNPGAGRNVSYRLLWPEDE
ncbi:MAG: Fic family protein [bacterium]|nr:Fic family protein [bacterium]